MTKKEYTEWAMSQMDKYGIRHPDTYSEREIKQNIRARSSKLRIAEKL